MKHPTVSKLAQQAKKEVGKNLFENVKESFIQHAEREMLRIRLQDSINRWWETARKTILTIQHRRTESWLTQQIQAQQPSTALLNQQQKAN